MAQVKSCETCKFWGVGSDMPTIEGIGPCLKVAEKLVVEYEVTAGDATTLEEMEVEVTLNTQSNFGCSEWAGYDD